MEIPVDTPPKETIYANFSSLSSHMLLLPVTVPEISLELVPTFIDNGADKCFISPTFVPLCYCYALNEPIML